MLDEISSPLSGTLFSYDVKVGKKFLVKLSWLTTENTRVYDFQELQNQVQNFVPQHILLIVECLRNP